MTTADSIHVVPVDQVLDLWAKGMSAVRIVARIADERGDRFTEDSVRKTVIVARLLGDPRAIFHRPGPKKRDWRG